MKYLTAKETGERWGLSERRVEKLCLQGRIPGLIRICRSWGIPDDAEKPKDERIKTGRYVKSKDLNNRSSDGNI